MTECKVCGEPAPCPGFVPEGDDLVLRSFCLEHARLLA